MTTAKSGRGPHPEQCYTDRAFDARFGRSPPSRFHPDGALEPLLPRRAAVRSPHRLLLRVRRRGARARTFFVPVHSRIELQYSQYFLKEICFSSGLLVLLAWSALFLV